MPQAIVDPDEIRLFARNLKKFSGEVQDRMTTLAAQLGSLGRTWRDQEHRKFVEVFEEHMRAMSRLVEVTGQYIPYLLRKAEIIEEYLQQR